MACEILAYFGDSKFAINLGRCRVSSGLCKIETTHSYRKPGKYTIRAQSKKCSYDVGPAAVKSITIIRKPQIPIPRTGR